MFEHVVDRIPEINKPLSAKYVKSFAHPTFKERLPNIIQGIVQDLKNKEEIKKRYGQAGYDELDEIIQKILNLKNSMQCDHPLVKIITNGFFPKEADVYNQMIEQRTVENNGKPPSWFQTEWLFAECYLYFKLHEIFYVSNGLMKYDPFLRVKVDTLISSHSAVLTLSQLLNKVKKKISLSEIEKKETFMFFLRCSLWGNKADLSLSGGKAVAANDDSFDHITDMDAYILVNDIEAVYKLLSEKEDNIVDIVLDNAGYELYNDLCFADFLIWSGLAKKVIFHGKAIPWFVSDVTLVDFNLTLNLLETKLNSENTVANVTEWKKYLREGKWTMYCEPFWILPYDYSKMNSEDSQLYCSLSESDLVIFKGDLNYRKLMGDIYWESTTSFRNALRGFEPTNVLALRTIKADTVSGLAKGTFEELTLTEPDWMITGKYGLVQLLRK